MAKILIAEDDALYRRFIINTLTGAKHEVVDTEDGEAALAALQTDNFDLIILDLMMPKLNGIDVLRQIRDQPTLQNVPVIVTTSVDKVEIVSNALNYGAKAYLIKSDMEPESLLAEVTKYLPASAAPAGDPAKAAPADDTTPVAP